MTRLVWRVVGASVLVAVVAGVGGCRGDAKPGAARAGAEQPAATATSDPANRVADFDLPAGFAPLSVEFADAKRGYALLTRDCPERCEARLYATRDGGHTWDEQRHPRPRAENHQIYVGSGPVVVLLAEPHAWYVSRDGGANWQSRPYDETGNGPAEYHSANGRFYLDCPNEGARGCVIRDWAAGPDWRRDVPAALRSARSLTNGPDGRLWLVGMDGKRIVTGYGQAGGGAFTRLAVPDQPGGEIWHARVQASADGRDVWLIADQDRSGGQGGGRLPARALARKSTGLPLIWQYQDGAWIPRPITGIKEERNHPYAVAPAGGGLLAITGTGVAGYLDRGAYAPAPGLPRFDWVSQLPDGTLLGRDNQPGTIHLGTGDGARREWARVKVSG